jgi:hypothetical protein
MNDQEIYDSLDKTIQEPDTKPLARELVELRKQLKVLLNKDFLQDLVELAKFLDSSYVVNWDIIKDKAHQGEDCGYAKQALVLFERLKKAQVLERIRNLSDTYCREV